tara:strand:+ start:916 stop:1263 length:348 start_codon:yes stop_codon:yes gene_type:complete
MNIQIKTSVGDFLDRWSILLIKEQKGLDVEKELSDYTKNLKPDFQDWGYYLRVLEAINGELWELEDVKRKGVERYSRHESDVAFLITQLNDLRHETKKRIDIFFNSDFTEKKSHG